MLISTEGIVIRSNIEEVSVIGRNTQGVKMMNMDNNDKVAALAAFEIKEDDK
jgi:DNA gyrase subunit A